MINWRLGGWTGSLNRWVKREVRQQLRENPVARRMRLPILDRVLRSFFGIGTFRRFVTIYLVIDLLMVAAEFMVAWLAPALLPTWTASGPPGPDIKAIILNVSSYLIGAQVGVLGVISIALALVTIIAERESSSTDVQLYYEESLAFEIVASCVALLAVLCAQLLWPLQFTLHKLGGGTELQVFKLVLLGFHTGWLLLNFAALAYFVTTTFRFVQQSAREELRERYTVNVVQPAAMTERLREQLYRLAGSEMLKDDDEDDREGRPSVSLGFDFGERGEVEIEANFKCPKALHDVRMVWVFWVVRRWAARCEGAAKKAPPPRSGLDPMRPGLIFTPNIDQAMRGKVGWCRRNGGVPLTSLERAVLRHAFRFRRHHDEA